MPRPPDFGCDPTVPSLPDDQGVHAGSIKISPSLRHEVVQALLGEGSLWPKPPLKWIEAVRDSERNSANSQAQRRTNPNLRWLALSQA